MPLHLAVHPAIKARWATVGLGPTSEMGRKPRFDLLPATSGLPRTTVIIRVDRLVRLAPDSDSSDQNGYEASFRLARSFLVRPSMQFRE
jgi:hypothetical protein